jgi:hypothetical protein
MKTALKMVGYIVGFLLMAAALIAIVLYIMGFDQKDNSLITTMPPVVSTTPAPDGNTTLEDEQQNGTTSVTVGTPTPFIEPTPTASPTPTPEPTPAPTPTPVPDPAGTPLGSGTFSSETGAWIDIDALWSAETIDNNNIKVTVTANLRSYRIQTGGSRNGLEIKLGDQYTAMDVEAMTIETEQEVTTQLGTYSFTCAAPKGQATALDLEVLWHFGGVYSGKQMDTISAGGKISIIR